LGRGSGDPQQQLGDSPFKLTVKAVDNIPFLTIVLNFIPGLAKDKATDVIFICPNDLLKPLPPLLLVA